MSEAATETPEWAKSELPEYLHDVPFLKDATDGNAFADQIRNAGGYMGKAVLPPGPDAPEDKIASFNKRVLEANTGLMPVPNAEDHEAIAGVLKSIGMAPPESADGYQLPEGVEVSDEAAAQFREQAHSLGLTQKQFDTQVAAIIAQGTEGQEAAKAALEQAMDGLKQEWGIAFKERMGEVGAFLRTTKDVPKEIADAFQNDRLDPGTIKWLHGLAELGAEPGQAGVQGDGGPKTPTSDEVEQRAQEAIAKAYSKDESITPQQRERYLAKAHKYNQMIAGEIPYEDLG